MSAPKDCEYESHQKTQETLAHRRAEATPTLTDDLIEISWIEDIGSVPISQRSSGAVITTVQIDNSECCKSELVRCQHQKIQETQGTHRDDHSIGLSRTDDIDLNAATLPISEANTVAVENMSGQSGTSRLEHDKVGTPAENEQHNFVKANMSEETDDYDEEVFQSCMESDDLEIVDYSSGVLIIRFKISCRIILCLVIS
ncbi:uncharacterized protein LOC119085668 [Bradysia coprophila]|uniref:uncharacterized protein LOC119085668 n=1 Tax=Bradysia coprophila TaxID=38358 RepID=UPI00187DD091|nr:uncharacterized protein LOC119085668 [Bradysia coprophila]